MKNPDIRCACGHPDLSANTNRRFHLTRIPDGPPTRNCFGLIVAPVPALQVGEVLMKVRSIAVGRSDWDRMLGAAHRHGFGPEIAVAARGVGEVVDSRYPDFNVADLVAGECGWQEYAVLSGKSLEKPHSVEDAEDIIEGFENLPEVLIGILHGSHHGNVMLRIS